MDNFEIIKECKISYEILNDLKDNCKLLNDDNTDELAKELNRAKINKMSNLLSDLYSSAWEILASNMETSKQLQTNCKDRFGHSLVISDLIDYAYLCQECDENQYITECEIDDVAWWLK